MPRVIAWQEVLPGATMTMYRTLLTLLLLLTATAAQALVESSENGDIRAYEMLDSREKAEANFPARLEARARTQAAPSSVSSASAPCRPSRSRN